ncbi:hypothetical protein WMY93_020203 [Mugilogobius chulae]|uniref:Nectin cell adhesion molecule 3 n=1 Tax=Mugilogobius chulae TaxID=88201 RepID=A0AAW0NRP9_9GOBI
MTLVWSPARLSGSRRNHVVRVTGPSSPYGCHYSRSYPQCTSVFTKPKNSAWNVTVQAGSKAVVVAQCEAVEGKPAANIKWLGSVGGNHSTSSISLPDGTVTVRSEYRLVPTPSDNGREVTCLVDQRTQDQTWVHPIKLSVEYPPSVSIEGYDHNWYMGRSDVVLTCQANANPAPTTVTWTSVSGPLPDSVVVDGNKLTVRKVDDAVNTTFVCEVKNKLGSTKNQITTVVIETLEDPSSAGVVAGAVIGSLLALLLVVALVAVLLTRGRRQQRRGYPSNGGDSIATSSGGNGGDYGNKARLLFGQSGNGSSSKNGTGGNNNGPMYTYREGCDATGTLTENHHHLHHQNPADILLSNEMDDAERRKFALDDSMEDDERFDRFGGVRGGGNAIQTAYQIAHRSRNEEEEMDVYLDDDMESQRDGSVISRTAIYV